MKKYSTVIIIFISFLYCIPISANSETNANLIHYEFGSIGYEYILLLPDNISDYEYMGHYPLTAFIFLKLYDEKKIEKIGVKQFMSGSLGTDDAFNAGGQYYHVLKFDKIKGFEGTAEKLKSLDEFGIVEQKFEIISKLKECYKNYKHEYETRYLKENYIFRKGLCDKVCAKEKKYNETINKCVPNIKSLFTYQEIDRGSYDFDNKLIVFDTLKPYSAEVNGWEHFYMEKFKNKYRRKWYKDKKPQLYRKTFPSKIDFPMNIEKAKMLFADNDPVYCETIVTVKPEEGFFGYSGGQWLILASNFSIRNVRKNYFKGKYWSLEERRFTEGPVMSVEFKSNEQFLFY